MSSFVKHERPKVKGARLALVLGVLWLVVLAAIWIGYRNDDGSGGGFLNFIARFHIIIVHLPIGVIFLAAAMEILSRFTVLQHLRTSLPFVYWIAFLGAIAATIAGYLLMTVEAFEGRAMTLHMYFGLGVVVFALFALVSSLREKWGLSMASILIASFMSISSGHFGGAMVHEGDYLTEHAPESLKPLLMVGLGGDKEEPEAVPGEEELVAAVPLGERPVYADFVVPILEAKCNECHNENKIKGKLRMDTFDLLLAGAEGTDYPTVIPGDADESEMIVRVLLPQDDDEFMPPKGDPLTPEEIQVLSLWINAGATQETTVAQLGEDPSIEGALLAVDAAHSASEDVAKAEVASALSVWDTLPAEEREARMDEVLAAATKYHFSVMPISAEDDRLRVNVINAAKEFGDDQLKLLEPVAERIVWLDLARSQVTDAGMETVGKMSALERLHLENTKVSDAGISELAGLTELEYLNLYGTGVGNGIFETFDTLPSLQRVYVWQTAVDASAARSFEKRVNLEINTGVEFASTAEEEAPAAPEAEKPADPKPAAEEKPKPAAEAKPAPKPEAKPAAKPEAKPAAKPESKPKEKAKAQAKAEPKPDAKPAPKPAQGAEAKPGNEAKLAPKAKADTPPKPADAN